MATTLLNTGIIEQSSDLYEQTRAVWASSTYGAWFSARDASRLIGMVDLEWIPVNEYNGIGWAVPREVGTGFHAAMGISVAP